MSKGMTAKERALKIEMARVRAAIERQTLVRSVQDLRTELRPRALLRSMMPSSKGGGATISHWATRALSLTRRYPILLSGVTALIAGRGKRRRLARMAGGLLLSWGMKKLAASKRPPEDTVPRLAP